MESLSFELDNYTVTLHLPRGGDADAVSVLARASELNTLNEQELVATLNALGCVDVNVSPR